MRCTGSIESLIGQIAEFGTLESSTKHVKHVYLIQQNPVSKWSQKVDLTDVPSIDPSDRQAISGHFMSISATFLKFAFWMKLHRAMRYGLQLRRTCEVLCDATATGVFNA